ncbi:hypothetical protein [Tumebacillus lipolyticus]|uniref:Uncharacterized protein n=1 Tax=Tumebacillus lipolyticus TaxID=1280370 RepID=A0ABW4ZTC9_9BACL
MWRPTDHLEARFDRLRQIVTLWEIRYNQLPSHAMELFDAQDIASIRELLMEKRELRRLIPDMKDFIERWEPVSQMVGSGDEEQETS